MPSGLWHFALSVGVCSLSDNNNNNNYFIIQVLFKPTCHTHKRIDRPMHVCACVCVCVNSMNPNSNSELPT